MVFAKVFDTTFYSLLGVSAHYLLEASQILSMHQLSTPFWEFLVPQDSRLNRHLLTSHFLLPFGSFLSILAGVLHTLFCIRLFLLPFGSFLVCYCNCEFNHIVVFTFYSLLGVSQGDGDSAIRYDVTIFLLPFGSFKKAEKRVRKRFAEAFLLPFGSFFYLPKSRVDAIIRDLALSTPFWEFRGG